MARKKKGKLNKMDVILIIDILLILAFTAIIIVLSCKGFLISEVLITCFYSCFGMELGIMGWIKTSKDKAETRKNELEDRKYFEKINKGDE